LNYRISECLKRIVTNDDLRKVISRGVECRQDEQTIIEGTKQPLTG